MIEVVINNLRPRTPHRFIFICQEQHQRQYGIRNFLKSLERELEAYIQILRVYFGKHKADMPLSGRLALESGIIGYESLLRWARCAIATYKKETRGRKTS